MSHIVGNALFVSHVKPSHEVRQMLEKRDDLKGITLTANPTKLSNPSTFYGAHCNQGFLDQLKAVQDQNSKIEADKEAKKQEKAKLEHIQLKGNEKVREDTLEVYRLNIAARGDLTEDMVTNGTEDNGFFSYLDTLTVPELKNMYKFVTISSTHLFGRSAPAGSKLSIINLIHSEVKSIIADEG